MTDNDGEGTAEDLVRAGTVSLARRVRELAREFPDELVYRHVGLDGDERVFAWPELDRWSDQLAGALAGRGVGLGDRLGLGLRNSPQFTVSVLAAWKLGAVPIPVRWDIPDWELTRLLEVIEPRVYLGADDVGWIDATEQLERVVLDDVVSPHVQGICSSGSTGTPKVILSGVPSVFNVLSSRPVAQMWRSVERPQTILVLAPMYHINGFSALHGFLAGDRLVVMEKFDAARVVDVIERHRISTFTATPTMLKRIADVVGIDDRDLSSLDWILQGAAPMPPSLVDRWAELIGAERIFMVYGMTETIGTTGIRGDEWMQHRGSVGRGFAGTELRILDADGNDVPAGEIGDVYLRATSFPGSHYIGDAQRLEATDDGFKTVGDLGYLDADGYLFLVDRRADLIVSGGANVFPAEVEAALIDHPKIADVVVIGLRDPEWGRRVHAIVEPSDPSAPPTLEEIVAYAKSRLAPYKVPKTIEVIDAIPRTEATKVNRSRLIEARGG